MLFRSVVAHPPAIAPNTERQLTPYDLKLIKLWLEGWQAREVARKLYPRTDGLSIRRRRKLERKFNSAIARCEPVQQFIAEASQGALIEGTEDVVNAVVRRAKTGRPDAAKFVMEASGFYNPKTRVEHSGEIHIKLEGLTRPAPVEDVTDAQVVD